MPVWRAATEASGPGEGIRGEKPGGDGASASGGGEQISGGSAGPGWSGEDSTHRSEVRGRASGPGAAWVLGGVSPSSATGEASGSIGTAGSDPTDRSEVRGELSACCGRNDGYQYLRKSRGSFCICTELTFISQIRSILFLRELFFFNLFIGFLSICFKASCAAPIRCTARQTHPVTQIKHPPEDA